MPQYLLDTLYLKKMEYYKNKKILIAGGSGLVGTNLFLRLIKLSKNVTASYFSKIQIKKYKKFYKKYDFTKKKDCLKATKNKEIVFITAVNASGILNMKKNFFDNINENFLIRSNLLESCVINKVKKVMWVSSSTVYQPYYKPITEKQLDLRFNPYEIYLGNGWLYRYLEKLFEFYSKNTKLDIKILRTSSIYGPYDNFNTNKSHVVPAIIKKSLDNKKNLEAWGDPYVVRDFVYVKDLVEAMLLVMTKKNFKILNFSYGKGCSIKNLVKLILKVTNKNKKVIFRYKNRSSAKYRVLNNIKFNQVIKNISRTSLLDGLIQTCKWYKKNKINFS